MVLLYLTGSLQIDSVHKLFHKHQREVSHTPEVESNGCHVALFHNQGKGSCEHPTHFSEDKKCPWCFASFQTKYLGSPIIYIPVISAEQADIIFFNLLSCTEVQQQNPSRAPPVI
jgi:hypothetical protein